MEEGGDQKQERVFATQPLIQLPIEHLISNCGNELGVAQENWVCVQLSFPDLGGNNTC
jgi:hypothetical protein